MFTSSQAADMGASASAFRLAVRRVLIMELAVFALAEALLFRNYGGSEARSHWATHLFIALTTWALANLLWLVLKGAPARLPLLTLLGWHLFAAFPDLLLEAGGVAPAVWMNVFLGHVWSHSVPAATYLWPAIGASVVYALVLAAWLWARRVEVQAGMAPGIGLGGSHLVRPQRAPDRTELGHHRYGPLGSPEVVLLHGLGASYAIWEPVAERLAQRRISVLVPDLLGFGRSRGIGTTFSLDDHVAAVARLLDASSATAPVMVGHSFGCAVAARFVDARPDRVAALVLVSPPAFRDGDVARARLEERGWLARQVLRGTPAASVMCNTMCLARGAAARVMPRFARNVPDAVARQLVEHTWPAYRDAMNALLHENPVPAAIDHPRRPTTVILGDGDRETPAEDVLDRPHGQARVELWTADHLLPLRQPDRLAEILAREVAARTTQRR